MAVSYARSILDIESSNACFSNNYYIAALLQKMGQKIPPGDLLGEYYNDFITYNFSVISDPLPAHACAKSPTLKSKLIFMDYRFKRVVRSPLYLWEANSDPKKSRQFDQLIITFGREGYRGNDVQIADSTNVSRRHCVIVNYRDDVWLYDLDSTGTQVNGEKVKGKTPLIGRNIVRIGSKEFVITNNKDTLI